MTAFTMMSIILTLSIAFGYLNYRFLKVQPAIATTMSALVLSIVLLILGHFGVHYIESTFREMMSKIDFYSNFQDKANKVKYDLTKFLIQAKEDRKIVIGYGAAAKGNTLLNFAGIKEDLLSCVVDKNPTKQNKFLPGSRIPILNEDVIVKIKPDYILILPWNLRNEVTSQLDYINDWQGKFVIAVPKLEVI